MIGMRPLAGRWASRVVPALMLGLVALWQAAGQAAAAATPPPFPHETNPYRLNPDPAFHFVRLENGLRAVLIPNQTPPREVVVDMMVLAGALDEPEDKAGLAHLLEHLAFQGSRRAEEPVFTRLERLGVRAGADANGGTEATRTVYSFRLPDNAPEKLRALVAIMRDIAGNLTLDSKTITQERAVVEQERVDRDSAGRRFAYSLYRFLVPGAQAGRHPVGGTKESIAAITRADLAAFYERFYRPENIVLVIAGDLPLHTMERILRAEFADFSRPGPAPKRDLEPEVPVPAALRAGHFVSADTTPAVLMFSHMPLAEWARADPTYSGRHAPRPDAGARKRAYEAAFKRALAWRFASYSFGLRLRRLQFAADPGFAAGGLDVVAVPRAARFLSLVFQPQGEDWRRAMQVMARELTRLVREGISAQELARARKNTREQLVRAAKQAATRSSAQLADLALSALGTQHVPRAPADMLADFEKLAHSITVADVSAEIARRFQGRPSAVFLRARRSPKAEGQDVDRVIERAWRRALATAEAEAAAASPPAAAKAEHETETADGLPYGRFGKPAAPLAQTTVPDWNFVTWRYPNNLVAHFKHTQLEHNKVRFVARVGDGVGGVPRERPALMLAGSTLLILGGLGKIDYPALAPILDEKGIRVDAQFDDGGLHIFGEVASAHFGFAMRLLAALLSDPGFRADGLALVKRVLEQQYAVLERAPNGVYLLHGLPNVFGGDMRFVGLPARFGDLNTLEAVDVARFLRPILEDEFLELSIVGDIAPEAVQQALATTVAALPGRAQAPRILAHLPAPLVAEGRSMRLHYAGKDVGSRVIITYPLRERRSRAEAAALGILADALAILARERVREGARLSYSPSASAGLDRKAGYRGTLSLIADGPAGKSKEVAASLENLLHELATRPLDADLLRRAKEPRLKAIEKIRDTNQGWLLTILDGLARDPERLSRLRDARDVVMAVSAEDVRRAAETVLRSAPHPWRFLVEPQSAGQP